VLRADLLRAVTEESMPNNPPSAHPYNVLFLCTGNSARSIMAEALLGRLGASKFNAFSAGSHPKGQVHPQVVEMLRRLNTKPEQFRSKSWDEFDRPDATVMDFVITVCDNAAGEVCPVWPGHPISAHWGVPDPAAARGTDAEIALAFNEAWRMLERRIGIFVNLPIASLDQTSLKKRLDQIGKATGDGDAA
jgi:protein-tyrosine-phosphatase